jgi:hypothetical protein
MIELSAYTVVIIVNALIIIRIVENKLYLNTVNVFIAMFALSEAINICLGLFLTFIFVDTEVKCIVYGFIAYLSLTLEFVFLPTMFVIIAKFRQMRLRTVGAVILIEVAASVICALLIVYDVFKSKEGCNMCGREENISYQMTKACEAVCFILAGSVLMKNRKQFKFGKSLGFLVTFFISWPPFLFSYWIHTHFS